MYRVPQVFMYKKCPKNVQKRAKTCKKRASQVLMHQKRASQVLISQKNVQKRAKTFKNVQKRAKTCITSIFGPNSKTCIFKVRAA